jgi:hypothetical protein
LACVGVACATLSTDARPEGLTPQTRLALLQRSRIWAPVDVDEVNIRSGPDEPGAFAPGETVRCEFKEHEFRGATPKFRCALSSEDEVKVKYGKDNGEVYGEVAATRLLWALGFGADRMYPVRVICRGCPAELGGEPGDASGERVFEAAAIEREFEGTAIESYPNEGWAWSELEAVEEAAGGAPRAHRDALKLIAVFLQHGDSKAEQQRLVCLDERCREPFLLISDLGQTFGRADIVSRQPIASVNLERWAATPIWREGPGCVGRLGSSVTGSLGDPVISEAGRAFLAGLLTQLTDRQIRELFEVARFPQRSVDDPKFDQETTVQDWTEVFKAKRADIVSRRCDGPAVITTPDPI